MSVEAKSCQAVEKETFTSSSPAGSPNKRYWWMWSLVLVVAFLIQLLTLDTLPHLQQDEAQITDYGRLALDPNSDWSVTYQIAEREPLLLWTYLGPLIAEVSFQLGNYNGLGPRVASVLGGMLAASMVFGWLLSRSLPAYAAFGLSLAFMLDPLFVISQRMGRVDSWVIACCIASCWLLNASKGRERNSLFRWNIMAGGGLAAVAAFIWPSAVFLYPLIILELVLLTRSGKEGADSNKYIISRGLYFIAGGLFAAVLLLLPIWQSLLIIFSDITTMVSRNVDSSKTFQDQLFALFNYRPWQIMVEKFVKTFSPLFPLLGLAGGLLCRNKGLMIVTAITIAMIFASLVYEYRILYLIPYFIALGSGVFVLSAQKPFNLLLKRFSLTALGLLLIWSVGTSLIVRTVLGFKGKTERDRKELYEVAASSVGPGNYKVFLDFTYEFYFVGRSLGWQLYTPYIQFSYDTKGNWIRENDYQPRNEFMELLSEMDYAFFRKGEISPELEEQLRVSGLHYMSTLRTGEEPVSLEDPQLQRSRKKMMLRFLQGKERYGSFLLYARDKKPILARQDN